MKCIYHSYKIGKLYTGIGTVPGYYTVRSGMDLDPIEFFIFHPSIHNFLTCRIELAKVHVLNLVPLTTGCSLHHERRQPARPAAPTRHPVPHRQRNGLRHRQGLARLHPTAIATALKRRATTTTSARDSNPCFR
jgi:hypothetical protein